MYDDNDDYRYDDYDDNDAIPMADNVIIAIVLSVMLLFLIIIVRCCFTNGRYIAMIESWVNSRASGDLSDAAYGSRALQVHQQKEENEQECPQARELRLLDAFDKNSTAMVRRRSYYYTY